MFLCALYVYPYPTNAELKQLKEGVEAPGVEAQEARNQVMVFCYSMLSTQQKSCLQYLTAFLHETEISRTSMVRRWVAEGLVGKEPGGGRSTVHGHSTRSWRDGRGGEMAGGEMAGGGADGCWEMAALAAGRTPERKNTLGGRLVRRIEKQTLTECGGITVPIWRGCELQNTKIAMRGCGVIMW
jgi:hypothetical protein